MLLLILAYFFLVSIYITYPLILHLYQTIFASGDALLITWIMNWDIHALLTNPLNLFNANIFYPYQNTLAYSDLHLTSAILGLPIKFIFKEPVSVYNFTILFALITTGYFTYLLVNHLTKSSSAGIISGTLFSFSTIHLNYLNHPQMLSLQWIPLSLLFFLKFLKTEKWRHLWLFVFFFLLQSLNSLLTMYFLFLVYALILLFNLSILKHRPWLWRKLCLGGVISLIILLPFILPYYQVSKQFHYQRDIRDTIHFSLQFEDFLTPSSMSRIRPWSKLGVGTASGYLGITLVVLSLISLISYLRQIRNKQGGIDSGQTKIFLIIALTSFVLSLGSALHLFRKTIHLPWLVNFFGQEFKMVIPLPYAIFYYLIPGFSGLRTPSRWIMMTAFGLSVLIGISLAKWLSMRSLLIKWLVVVVICLITILEFNFPLHFKQVPTQKEFPTVYQWLAGNDEKGAIIELPMYKWDMQPYADIEFRRQYYSTLDWRPRVNGYSGFSPQEWEERTEYFMLNFPDQITMDYLKKTGVKYLVLHQKEYQQLQMDAFKINGESVVKWEKVVDGLEKFNKTILIKRFADDYVYGFTEE